MTPKPIHWKVAHTNLEYIRASALLGLTYSVDFDIGARFTVYVDADYGSEQTARRLVSAAVVMCSVSPAVWLLRTQMNVTL